MKFALYADVDLNLIDGSAIWVTSVVEVLSGIPENKVHVYLKAPITQGYNVEPLFAIANVTVIPPMLSAKRHVLSPEEALQALLAGHAKEHYDSFFLRGLDLCYAATTVPEMHGKIWAYFTNVPTDVQALTTPWRKKIASILDAARYVLVQTPQMHAYMEGIFPEAAAKIRDLPPMVPSVDCRSMLKAEEKRNSRQDGLRIVYSGQFKKDYATLEMLQIFEELVPRFPQLELHVFGEKFHCPPGEEDFRKEVLHRLETSPGVYWHKGLSREDVLDNCRLMDVGWAWRTDKLEANTLEISTKVLEFSVLGLPPIMARNAVNEAVFGEEYPLYANTYKEARDRLLLVLENPELLKTVRHQVRQCAAIFCYDHIRTHYLQPLCPTAASHTMPLLCVAGHDLKFVEPLLRHFAAKAIVARHYWWGHCHHDVKASEDIALKADIIFCEWFLGNAVWHSHHKRPGSKLIVRFHLQELNTVYPSQADMEAIDQVVVVSEHTRRDAVKKFGWEEYAHKIRVIPNAIDWARFRREKFRDSLFQLGLVGITPKRKRLDLALDILEKCRAVDRRFTLRIKGKRPDEYLWLRDNPDELAFFTEQMRRIDTNPVLHNAVQFDGWSNNMGEWYRNIGFILSVSDFEGTHQAVAEGGASGAMPIIRNWEGADEVYRKEWVYSDTDAMAEKILEYSHDAKKLHFDAEACSAYMKSCFDTARVTQQYMEIL